MTVEEIIKAAGGAEKIARASDTPLSHWAVYKWARSGIPWRHWPLMMRLAGVSLEEIHDANGRSRRMA